VRPHLIIHCRPFKFTSPVTSRPADEICKTALSEVLKSDLNQQGLFFVSTYFCVTYNVLISGSSISQHEQLSNIIDLTASSSELKRKRSSINISPQSTKQLRMDENSHVKPHSSPGRVLTPLKNGLSKVGLGSKEKELDPSTMVKKFRLEPKNLGYVRILLRLHPQSNLVIGKRNSIRYCSSQ
jgi:hypothetical protein